MKPRNVHGLVALAIAAAASFGEACAKSEAPSQATPSSEAPQGSAAGRRIDIKVEGEGYVPATIEAKKGEELVLRFTRTVKGECLSKVVFPDLKIEKELPLDTPVEVAVKADKEGKIAFQCGMAMAKGTVNVTN